MRNMCIVKKYQRKMNSLGSKAFRVTSCKQNGLIVRIVKFKQYIDFIIEYFGKGIKASFSIHPNCIYHKPDISLF